MPDFGFDLDVPNPLAAATSMIQEGRPLAALEMLARFHDAFADHTGYLLLCARAWRDVGDPLRAQHALLGAVRVAPNDPQPLAELAELLLERGELERARKALNKASALSPAHAKIAELRRRSDQLSALEEATSTATDRSLAPSETPLSEDLIALAEEEESVRPVVRATGGARPSLRTWAKLLVALGVVGCCAVVLWVSLRAPTESTEPSSANVAKPRTEPSASSLAPLRTAEPPPLRSAASSERVAPVEASSKAVRVVERANWLYARGNKARAATLYRRALRIDPDYGPALVGVGRSLLHAKNYDQALVFASRVLQERNEAIRSPEVQAAALYQVGRIHHERGDRVAARRILREATAFPGAPHEAWFYLGETLSRENSPAARSAYERYLSLVPDGPLSSRARRAIR